MSNNFIFDFLPSFYSNLNDENGNNILLPLFGQYANAMGDTISQAQQIANMPYLEKCPLFIKEYFKTIDIRLSNKYLTGYLIDSDIIVLDGLFYDSAFTIPIINFSIKHDISNNTRYIEINDILSPLANTLYSPSCLKDKNILQNIFGNLLDYKPQIPLNYHDNIIYNYTTNYNNLIIELEKYRSQLIALTLGLVHGPTYKNIETSLAIFIGLKYSPFDAIVKSNDGNTIILEEVLTEKILKITGNINSLLTIGTLISKYTIVENLNFKIYDMYSDPARFTQYLLYNKSAILLQLLNINIIDNETYAHLTYDSKINFDSNNIYWDMGNNTNINHSAPPGTSNYTLLPVMDHFDDYVDDRFNSKKIYEMFRNLFIIETTKDVAYFLNRVKSKFTKFIVV